MVLTLCVISSPIVPSPRVAPLTSCPFLYNRETLKPSILSSHTYSGSSTIFLTLESKSKISSKYNKFSDFAKDAQISTIKLGDIVKMINIPVKLF